MTLNSNIPKFRAFVRKSWLTKNNDDYNVFDECYVFAVQSVPGRILSFHLMTDYGALRNCVPLSEVFVFKPKSDIQIDFKQLWDCFSYNVSVIKYEYLDGKRCIVTLKDKSTIWATYFFTVDWYDNDYSDDPVDYKCGHILYSDDGYLLCQPNNRIEWKDMNFITKPMPDKSQFKTDTNPISVEDISDRWVSDDTNCFYYDIKRLTNNYEQFKNQRHKRLLCKREGHVLCKKRKPAQKRV